MNPNEFLQKMIQKSMALWQSFLQNAHPRNWPKTWQELKSKLPSAIFKHFFFLMVAGTMIPLLIGGVLVWEFSSNLPNIITLKDYHPALVTQLVAVGTDTTGDPKQADVKPQVIAEYKKERRYIVPYEKVPEKVVRAFISAEDDKFFQHPGIDISGMIRALLADLKAGHKVQGGSTITQQVTKSLILTPEKTWTRKIKEIILAQRLEKNLTKQQILYLYLNNIYLGHGAYGVEAASQTYFRKPVGQVTLAEAAIMAGMTQAPGKYSPLLNPKRAKERQTYVLHRMQENGYITPAQAAEALAEPVRVYSVEDVTKKYAPYYAEYVRKYIIEKYGETALYEGGLTVLLPTTAQLMLAAQKSVRSGLEAVDKRGGYRGPIKNLATQAEMDAFSASIRAKLIEDKIESQMLMADGRLDGDAALKAAGVKSDLGLVSAGETYQALVTDVSDKKKEVTIRIGNLNGTLSFDHMTWAKPYREEKGVPNLGPEPKLPSAVLKTGDVIVVRVLSTDPKAETLVVALDQDPLVQGALFSMEAQTGYVLALVGGYSFENSEFNRATQAERPPGSAFKPLLYSAALEKGFTPASVIVDSPIVYNDGDAGKWKPSNFEEKFYGDTTFRQALIKSRNVPTIKILQQVQIPFLLDYVKRLGIDSPVPADLSISLGSAGVSLYELTKVYSLFPRLGRKIQPIFFKKIIDRDGKVLEENKPEILPETPKIAALPEPSPAPSPQVGEQPAPEVANKGIVLPTYPPPDDPSQVLDPRIAYVMTHLMKEVVAYGTGHEAQDLGRPAAGKTGTTSDYIDAWFMGFTPHVVTGSWVGYDNRRPIGHVETGAKAALPIWLSFMREATQPYPAEDFLVPPGIVFASIDPNSGKLVSPNSLNAIKEAFIEGTQPSEQVSGEKTPAAGNNSGDFFKEDSE